MVHGPCGVMKPSAPWMNKMRFMKYYPKKFQNQTMISEDGFLVYIRRDQTILLNSMAKAILLLTTSCLIIEFC